VERNERFARIQRLLQTRPVVRLSDLCSALEVSRATIFRDLSHLTNRVGLPIVFDRERNGYCLNPAAARSELPGLWFTPGEIYALLSMQRLLASVDRSGVLGEQLAPLHERLLTLLESQNDSAIEVARRVRIVSAAARTYAPQHFQTIASALLERRRIRLTYVARRSGEETEREVSPLRLTHYRDNWYLDAWCHLRRQLRRFAVDAIESVRVLETLAHEIDEAQLDAALGAGYGVFAGSAVRWATLLFSADRARWVAAEDWHPQQRGRFLPDGRYQLVLPYSDDPELIMDVLKYGPDCTVVAPPDLRAKVRQRLQAAIDHYAGD